MASRKRKTPIVVETVHDEIGFWSETKLEILRKYWPEYMKIMKGQQWDFHTLYFDAFAGSGMHVSRTSGELVKGSPARALEVEPPFDEYHFVDLDAAKIQSLEQLAAERANVHVHHGDCNQVLRREIFPLAEYRRYRRAVCLLDPYSLQLDWNVIAEAAAMKSIEIFLNFPIMDINRNVLREGASTNKIAQMNRFWGDDSWRTAAFRQEKTLFGDVDEVKVSNYELVAAFRKRLQDEGGFAYVPEPLAMKNSTRATVYYCFSRGTTRPAARL